MEWTLPSEEIKQQLTYEWKTLLTISSDADQPYSLTKVVLMDLVIRGLIDFKRRGNRKYFRKNKNLKGGIINIRR